MGRDLRAKTQNNTGVQAGGRWVRAHLLSFAGSLLTDAAVSAIERPELTSLPPPESIGSWVPAGKGRTVMDRAEGCRPCRLPGTERAPL
jgi:hypothetical protein